MELGNQRETGYRMRKMLYSNPDVLDLAGFPLAIMTTLYGIKSCDTMKKARVWLDAHKIAYAFHDYKASGIDKATLERWASKVGWETLINRAGTTFRKLPDADRDGLTEKKAVALMLAQPPMIKRPVLDNGGELTVGFRPEVYQGVFAKR